MRHQLGLVSGARYACLTVGSRTRFRISWPELWRRRVPTYFPRPSPGPSGAGDGPASRAISRITPTTSCNERHALSSCIDFTHTVTSCGRSRCRGACRPGRAYAYAFPGTQNADTERQDECASRSVIRRDFFTRAARFILSNTPRSVSLGDAGGYAKPLRTTHLRHSLVRNSRLRNATALDTQLTQRTRNWFRRTERTSVENSSPDRGRLSFSEFLRKIAAPPGLSVACCATDSPKLDAPSRRGTLTTEVPFVFRE